MKVSAAPLSLRVQRNVSMKDMNKLMLSQALDIASKTDANAIFIYADVLNDYKIPKELVKNIKLVYFTRSEKNYKDAHKVTKNVILLPDIELTRIGQIKVSLVRGLSAGIVKQEDKVVCASGSQKLGNLDSIMVLEIGKEHEVLTLTDASGVGDQVRHEVFDVVLNIALELASHGRDGRPIGTIFVLGDDKKVMQLSRQMIINPFQGYPEEERNILDPKLKETIQEFSAIDGAFVIREDGLVLTAGRHLNAASEEPELLKGLGSRHLAASGITSVTEAVAIVISESTSSVRIFKSGKMMIELERPPS
jgi:DNA integrity scanning protein DisA with diadenylate cyclase activity